MADPVFDPNKPYTEATPAAVPVFDPSKPFTEAKPKGVSSQATEGSLLDKVWQGVSATTPLGPIKGSIAGVMGQEPPHTTDLGSKILSIPEKAGWFVGKQVRGVGDLIQRVMDPATNERLMAGAGTPEEKLDLLSAASLGVGASPGVAGEVRMAQTAHAPLTPAQQRLQDFEGAGVTPNVPAIGQGRAAGLTAQAGRVLPFSPVGAGMKRSLGETAQAAERTASQYGTAADEFSAGNTVRNALRRFAADKSQAKNDYGEFDRLMQGDNTIDISGTVGTIKELQGRFIDNPGLAKLSSRLEQKLGPPVEYEPAQVSVILDENGRLVASRPEQAIPRNNTLSMKDLKDFRTEVGYRLENPSFGPEDIPRGQLRQLYASLTQDMQRAARAQSPEANRALTKATMNYGMRMRQLDRLEPLIKPDAPERVFQRIESASRGGNSGLLGAVKKAVTPEEWNNVGAAMIRNFGNPSAGAVKVAGTPDFSIDTFATNWNKLDGRSKDLIFGPNKPGSARDGLERLSRVVNAQKAVGKLANTSHTYELGAAAAMLSDVMASLYSGRNIVPDLAAFTGAYGVSKLMMSPAFTRWLYKASEFTSPEEGMVALSDILTHSALPIASNTSSSNTKKTTPPRSPTIDTQSSALRGYLYPQPLRGVVQP